MMYQIITTPSAKKEIKALPNISVPRINKAIRKLAENPRPSGSRKLVQTKENLWRIRVGDYRVIYLIEDVVCIVEIRKVRHRKDAYRL